MVVTSSTGWASDGGDSSFNGIISKGGGGAPGWRATNGRAGGSGSGSQDKVVIILDQVRVARDIMVEQD